jgi:hypothetical protein
MGGKANLFDRIAEGLVWLAALFALANGAFMLFLPMGWYEALPTVRATGPANTHFIADIGIAYLGCAVILLYAVMNLRMRWLAALAGGLWLMAHGALHFYELVTGICSPDRFWADFPGTIGVPLLVLIAVASLIVRRRIAPAGLPKSIVLGLADRTMPEESAYIREIGKAPGHAFEKFLHFMPASNHRHAAPASLASAARIGSVLVEDCGPCALTSASGGLADGVDRDRLNAALAGGEGLDADDGLAFRFGEAIARQSPEADLYGEEIEKRFGRTVRLELALVAAMVRAYPAIKRGLGLTTACSATQLSI